MKGQIFVIEGTDGSGKQLQSKLLYEKLIADGKKVLLQSFPNYESQSSGPVKMYLGGELSETANEIDAYQASTLFAVDRFCTMKQIEKFYLDGGIIILDRYVESNMMHQAGKIDNTEAREKFLDWIDEFEFGLLKLPRPDKVIFLNVAPEVSKKLREKRGINKNGQKKDIHEQDDKHIVNAYNAGVAVSKKFGWIEIDCSLDGEMRKIEEIHAEICEKLGF